ncbi:MAG: hypothetical protein ABR543_13585 [Gemmatimonadaceae bacterium]
MPRSRSAVGLLLFFTIATGRNIASQESMAAAGEAAYMRGLDLEQREKYRDAAEAFRESLVRSPASVPALLGLERVYAQLGWTDSILGVLDSAIALKPRERSFRVAQLRSFLSLGSIDRMRASFERWARDWPRDPVPHREFARLLIQEGRTLAADTVLRRAQQELGSGRGLESEIAQLRAAMGLWELAAEAWRGSLSSAAHMEQAAVFSLLPAPDSARRAIRRILLAPPQNVGARRFLAALELGWGASRDGWMALRDLTADSATIVAWQDFASRAEEHEAWLAARDALLAVYDARRKPEIAVRAASNALAAGDASGAAVLAEMARQRMDSATAATSALPVLVRALSEAGGRALEAERLVSAYSPYLGPEQRARLAQMLAWAWVRSGNTVRASELMREGRLEGGRASSSAAFSGDLGDPAGWIALYEGDLEVAREKLKPTSKASAELLAALAVLSRTSADSALLVGRAFLALAQADTLGAAANFEASARVLREAASLLLASAARLHSARRDETRAVPLWTVIALEHGQSPEAPEANLEWARSLRRSGRAAAAIERLELLILTYPQSALVPQARRELDLARATVPPAS